MFYIHQTYCISPQQTFKNVDWTLLHESSENKLNAIEPAYENVPRNLLRRMGKSVRIGIGTAFPIVQEQKNIDGIVIGTATAGKEDSFSFLKQVMEYEEGLLSPTNFVQSTSNAIASQIGMLSQNKNYNITHVHEGLAFENAAIDIALQLQEDPNKNLLLGGVDELSDYDFNLNKLADCYKKEFVSNKELYQENSPGTLAGEGSTMFLVNNEKGNSIAKVELIQTLFSINTEDVQQELNSILEEHSIDIFISGENGDNRIQHFYNCCEAFLNNETTIVRFKQLCGEYPTASAFAVFLACDILNKQHIPTNLIKKGMSKDSIQKILLYNNYQGKQHSFILISKP